MGMKRGDVQAADELALVDAALQGDIEAFAELHERYRSDLYALCLRRLNDPSLAEDAVQDIFIRAFKSFPNFDRDRPVWPWFVNVAYKACIDIQRRRSFTHYSGDIAVSMDAGGNGHTESALDTVIASEERAELWKSLDVLPERQRRAFVLYEVDGLSCADIAAAEGISTAAVYRLLFRARKKLRSVHQNGPLPAIAFPLNWLRWKLQQIEERFRPLLSVSGEGFSTACVQAVCLGALVTMMVATGLPNALFDGDEAASPDRISVVAAQSLPLQTASLQTALPNIGGPAPDPVEPQQPVADPASSLVNDLINPNQNATPEDSTIQSIAISPAYESDHTILAGSFGNGGSVLFVSPDGGANWKPLPSRLLSGGQIVLPPSYPRDPRIFSYGNEMGIQRSDDGGQLFKPVSPLTTYSFAIEPSNENAPRMLIGGLAIFDYDNKTGLTQPLLNVPITRMGVFSSIVFSPSYSLDKTFFASTTYGYHFRCEDLVCSESSIPTTSRSLLLSPEFARDGLAYIATDKKLLVSNDGARTFREVQFLIPDRASIWGMAVLWNSTDGPIIFLSTTRLPTNVGPKTALHQSKDEGRSWSQTEIDLSALRFGGYPGKLWVTPTGRVLVTGMQGGITCSADLGETWASRCPPES